MLVITVTRYAQAIATSYQTSKHQTAEALFNECQVHFGIPLRLHGDQGANCKSKIQELYYIIDKNKSRTTPYNPMGYGLIECFNRTLIQLIGALENS